MQRWNGPPCRRGVLALAGVATLALALDLAIWTSAAQATVHHVSGNLRLQTGNGLPVPITPAPVPEGAVVAAPGATVMQTAGPNPKRLSLPPGALSAPGATYLLGVFPARSNVFQVRTALEFRFPQTMTGMGGPAPAAVFSAGGRTGGMTESYCPGSGATPPFACASPQVGFARVGVTGLLRYTATKSQFGGPARAGIGGSADVALRASGPAPCAYAGGTDPACVAWMARSTPAPTGPDGAPFGVIVTRTGMAPATGRLYVTVTSRGEIQAATPTPQHLPGAPNPATSYGGPWTTGRLTVSLTNNIGVSPSIFVLSGSDARAANGAGALSLVSGSVTARKLLGPRAKRGWLNLQIGPPTGAVVPGLPLAALVALAASTALSGGYALRRGSRRA